MTRHTLPHLSWRHVCATATTFVAVIAFWASFIGGQDYGRRVMLLGDVSFLVPLGVDGLTLCAIAATQVLRHEATHVRFYAWFVFCVAAAMSVATQLSHAVNKNMSPPGVAGSMAVPVVMAFAVHLLVVVLRHHDTRHDTTPRHSTPPRHDTAKTTALVSKPPKPSKPLPPQPGGQDVGALAKKLGVSARTVQRRLKKGLKPDGSLPAGSAGANPLGRPVSAPGDTPSVDGERVMELAGSGGKTPG